jgi:hypothetical protein
MEHVPVDLMPEYMVSFLRVLCEKHTNSGALPAAALPSISLTTTERIV